jgi:hypothetical protein
VPELVPGLRRLDAGVLERVDVEPDRRLVGALEDEAVELAADRPELHEVGRVVGADRVLGEVERLQGALLLELLDQARLGDGRQVRRVAALDRGAQDRRDVVAGRVVLDRDLRVLRLERVEHRLEGLLLIAGPDADDRDLAGDVLAARDGLCAARRAVVVVAAAAAGGDEREYAQRGERCCVEPMPHEVVAPFAASA